MCRALMTVIRGNSDNEVNDKGARAWGANLPIPQPEDYSRIEKLLDEGDDELIVCLTRSFGFLVLQK